MRVKQTQAQNHGMRACEECGHIHTHNAHTQAHAHAQRPVHSFAFGSFPWFSRGSRDGIRDIISLGHAQLGHRLTPRETSKRRKMRDMIEEENSENNYQAHIPPRAELNNPTTYYMTSTTTSYNVYILHRTTTYFDVLWRITTY